MSQSAALGNGGSKSFFGGESTQSLGDGAEPTRNKRQHTIPEQSRRSSVSNAYIISGTRVKRRKMVVDCKALRAKVTYCPVSAYCLLW